MKIFINSLIVLAVAIVLSNANAQDEIPIKINAVTMGVGESRDDIYIYRLGLKRDFNLLSTHLRFLSGYYEASINYWMKGKEHITGAAFSPVFLFTIPSKHTYLRPYLEAGIGISIISDTVIGDRNLSSAFNFEDRIGFGLRWDKYDINFRYMHYSNAGLYQPNEGIDIFILTLSCYFFDKPYVMN